MFEAFRHLFARCEREEKLIAQADALGYSRESVMALGVEAAKLGLTVDDLAPMARLYLALKFPGQGGRIG